MRRAMLAVLFLLTVVVPFLAHGQDTIPLPSPRQPGAVSVEEALDSRKSVRLFRREALEMQEISKLLWAVGGLGFDGVTRATRSYPSAGGIYPLAVYLVVGEARGLDPGIYRYVEKNHALELIDRGDRRVQLAEAALMQFFIASAPVVVVIAAEYAKTERKYGSRGSERYVPLDAGHAAQCLHLQAVALGLASVPIGAFWDARVKNTLGLTNEEPLLIVPVGRPRE
jgi:SagB-type dehydrogenase family enzyme